MSNDYKVYIDKKAIMQVVGGILNEPIRLQRTDKYNFYEEDFGEDIYKIIYGAATNLRAQGLKTISLIDLENYFMDRPSIYEKYNKLKGADLAQKMMSINQKENFDYYYSRMKKFTLLRMYQRYGIDIKWLYNPDLLDIKKKMEQEDWLNDTPLIDIDGAVNEHINKIRSEYLHSLNETSVQAGQSIFELIENLQKNPDFGISIEGDILNSIVRGARLKKFYLYSMPTGVGKSRLGVANFCKFGATHIYNLDTKKWEVNEFSSPSLFIATEQDYDEIQTIILAYLSGVNEDHIVTGKYDFGEKELVLEAGKILQNSPMWIEKMNDFSLADIENSIRRNVIDNKVMYIVHDYMYSSMTILQEVASRSGIKMREDQVLFMMAIRMKDLANELGVYIQSATQLSADWEEKDNPNQNQLRGAKAIGDKIDMGAIALPVREQDLKFIEQIVKSKGFPVPNMVHQIYKNRRGRFNQVKVWSYVDLGTARVTNLFVTDNRYQLVSVPVCKVGVKSNGDKHISEN